MFIEYLGVTDTFFFLPTPPYHCRRRHHHHHHCWNSNDFNITTTLLSRILRFIVFRWIQAHIYYIYFFFHMQRFLVLPWLNFFFSFNNHLVDAAYLLSFRGRFYLVVYLLHQQFATRPIKNVTRYKNCVKICWLFCAFGLVAFRMFPHVLWTNIKWKRIKSSSHSIQSTDYIVLCGKVKLSASFRYFLSFFILKFQRPLAASVNMGLAGVRLFTNALNLDKLAFPVLQ